jgi:hypothetical protein
VLVVADRRLLDFVMVEQLLRLSRVLACDQINLLKHADGAHGDVLKVADGRSNEVQAGREFGRLWHSRSVAK